MQKRQTPNRFAVISGLFGVSRKKLGNTPKRFSTWASSSDIPLPLRAEPFSCVAKILLLQERGRPLKLVAIGA